MRAFYWELLIVAFITSSSVHADSARAPYDYVMEVTGEKYLLVMLANHGGHLLDPGRPEDVGVIDTDMAIRGLYRQSGLYSIGESAPLWTLSWYAFTVFPSSDGDHLVRLGPWASSVEQLAISFYSKGVEIKRYLIRDLVKDSSRLRNTTGHFFWKTEDHYDDAAQLFYLTTVDGRKYRFSILTGEVVP